MINRWVKESGTVENGYEFPRDTFDEVVKKGLE
jgi:hypothetical protein